MAAASFPSLSQTLTISSNFNPLRHSSPRSFSLQRSRSAKRTFVVRAGEVPLVGNVAPDFETEAVFDQEFINRSRPSVTVTHDSQWNHVFQRESCNPCFPKFYDQTSPIIKMFEPRSSPVYSQKHEIEQTLSLPPLAKKCVLQMMYIDAPVHAKSMEEWVLPDGLSKHRVAIDRLVQLRGFTETVDRKKETSYEMNRTFQNNIQKQLIYGGGGPRVAKRLAEVYFALFKSLLIQGRGQAIGK